MNASALKSALLFGCLALLGGAQIVAYALFRTNSVDFIARNHDASALAYSRSHVVSVPATLSFGDGQADRARLGGGWNLRERDGIWSSEDVASLLLVARPSPAPLLLRIDAAAYVSDNTPVNRIAVFVNGTELAAVARSATAEQSPFDVRVPENLLRTGLLYVQLRVDRCVSPMRDGNGDNPARLGLLLRSVEIRGDGMEDRPPRG